MNQPDLSILIIDDNRIRASIEAGAELHQWLLDGAHFYICGDAKRMAKDVEGALVSIVAEQARLSPDAAKMFVEDLKRAKRYQADVY